jgi:mRNA interferase MazF
MVKRKAIVRGEVWLAALDPTVGREIRKTRPCVVVSPDSMNRFLATVTAVPLTSGSTAAGFRVPVTFKGKDGFVLCDQLRTLDRTRLIKRLGTLDGPALHQSLAVLRDMFED